MYRKLSEIDKAILCGAARDLKHFLTTEVAYGRDTRTINRRIARQDALKGIVHVDAGRWLKTDTTGDVPLRMAISRSYARLQKLGLLTRVADGWSPNRTTHLELTAVGKRVAEQLDANAIPAAGEPQPGAARPNEQEATSDGE
jgi:hypothetical protein